MMYGQEHLSLLVMTTSINDNFKQNEKTFSGMNLNGKVRRLEESGSVKSKRKQMKSCRKKGRMNETRRKICQRMKTF